MQYLRGISFGVSIHARAYALTLMITPTRSRAHGSRLTAHAYALTAHALTITPTRLRLTLTPDMKTPPTREGEGR